MRVNVTIPRLLHNVAGTVVQCKGFLGISDYLQACLRRDAASLGMSQFDISQITR